MPVTDSKTSEPIFVDYRGTGDHALWVDLKLTLCSRCGSKPTTDLTGEYYCINEQADCPGIPAFKSKRNLT
jgi:hypothetical protein